MNWIAKITVIYFPLVLVYKLFGQYKPIEDSYKDEYWINSYWFLTALYFMLIFIFVLKLSKYVKNLYALRDYTTYSIIIKSVAFYWGIMAGLRFYLFFNIALYSKIISGVNTLTIGGVSIVVLLIYLTAKIWHRK